MASSASHYDPSNDVILRLETMSAVEARVRPAHGHLSCEHESVGNQLCRSGKFVQVLNFLLWSGLIMALSFLVYEFAQKLIDVRALRLTMLLTYPAAHNSGSNQSKCLSCREILCCVIMTRL